jgi:hypothetical protein
MLLHTPKPIKMPVNLDLSIVAPLVVVSRDDLHLVSRIASASLIQYVGQAIRDAVKLSPVVTKTDIGFCSRYHKPRCHKCRMTA